MEQPKAQFNFNFTKWRLPATIFSTVMVLLSVVVFFVIEPKWGIDFTGGTEIQLQFQDDVSIGELRGALSEIGVGDDAVQQIGADADRTFAVRIQSTEEQADVVAKHSEEARQKIEEKLKATFGADWIADSSFDAQVGSRMTVRYDGETIPLSRVKDALASIEGVSVREAMDEHTLYIEVPGISSEITDQIRTSLAGKEFKILQSETVGAKVGGELRAQGFLSMLWTLALILIYVAFRFNVSFAPGAVLALVHDAALTIGLFTLTRHEFNLPMIGALLTIIGYSLNDTIVIYDRIRENMERYRRKDLEQLINDSINETLGRTLATAGTTLVAMGAFLFMGGPVIQTFAQALTFGIVIGSYSTIFVASPMVLLMQDFKPWLERITTPLAGAAASAGAKVGPVEPAPPADPAAPGEAPAPEQGLTQTELRRRARQGPPPT